MSTETRESIRLKNKALYRKQKGQENLATLAGKELASPPRRVETEHGFVSGYSIVMAAKALGKSVIQIRSWISKGYIPEPIIYVAAHKYYVYDVREMQIIRKHLYRHTKKGISYLTSNSVDFVDGLHAEISEHRRETYGKD